MCGIFGFVGKFDKDVIRALYISHQARGSDATGCAIFKDKSLIWLKNPVTASRFIQLEYYENIENENPNIMLCHTRAATQGDKRDNRNNHPFIDKSKLIALVHNGMINNYEQVVEDLQVDGKCDSEVILALLSQNLDKYDVITSIENTVNKISGWYNFAFIYKRKMYVFSDGNIDLIKYNGGIYFIQVGHKHLGEKDGLFFSTKALKLKTGRLAIIELLNGIPKLSIKKIKVANNYTGFTNPDWYESKGVGCTSRENLMQVLGCKPRYCVYMDGTCHNPLNCFKCDLKGHYVQEKKNETDETTDYSNY